MATLTDEELREMAMLFILTYYNCWDEVRDFLQARGALDERCSIVPKAKELGRKIIENKKVKK